MVKWDKVMLLIKNEIKEGKKIMETGSEQVSFQLDIVKNKLKIYSIQKKINVEVPKLGDMLYNFFQTKKKEIRNDKQIINLVESIKEKKNEINKTEQEIINIESNFKEAKEKLYSSCMDLFENIKEGLKPDGKTAGETEIGANPPIEQKTAGFEEEKKEVKEAKKTTAKKSSV